MYVGSYIEVLGNNEIQIVNLNEPPLMTQLLRRK